MRELEARVRDHDRQEAEFEAGIASLEGQLAELADEGADTSDVEEQTAQMARQIAILREANIGTFSCSAERQVG